MRTLEFRQFLPMTMAEAWAFFSQPANLGRITPPAMNFVIRSEVPEKVYPGLLIRYRLSPLLFLRISWVTEITHVDEPHYFVDEQRSGPYAIWHHEHHFAQTDGGVVMTDRLFYHVPGGVIGRMLDRVLIRKKVEGIFAYRKEALERLFKK